MGSPSPQTSVATSTFDESYAALSRGDYATALNGFRTLAERGDADAQYNLGVMYANGEGVARDYAEAVSWYRMAAEQGHAVAQNKLGVRYACGEGVARDYAEAVALVPKGRRARRRRGPKSTQAPRTIRLSHYVNSAPPVLPS